MGLTRTQFVASAAALTLSLTRRAGAQTLDQIRMTAVPTDDMTPIYYAIASGLYRKAGLDVTVIPATSGSASTAAVVGGSYDMGKASPVASLLAHAHGIPITIVANGAVWNSKNPWNVAVVASDSPLKTAADCNGKVGAAPGLNDITHLGLQSWVDKNGGDSKSMKWVEIPNSALGPALQEHRIDITTINEPQLSVALESGKVRPIGDAYGSIGDHWAASVYLARPDWAAKNADAMKRFARATYDAAAYTNAHKAETIPMMAEITKIPAAVFAKMTRIEGTSSPDPVLIQPVIDLAVRYKALAAAFPAKDMYFSA